MNSNSVIQRKFHFEIKQAVTLRYLQPNPFDVVPSYLLSNFFYPFRLLKVLIFIQSILKPLQFKIGYLNDLTFMSTE